MSEVATLTLVCSSGACLPEPGVRLRPPRWNQGVLPCPRRTCFQRPARHPRAHRAQRFRRGGLRRTGRELAFSVRSTDPRETGEEGQRRAGRNGCTPGGHSAINSTTEGALICGTHRVPHDIVPHTSSDLGCGLQGTANPLTARHHHPFPAAARPADANATSRDLIPSYPSPGFPRPSPRRSTRTGAWTGSPCRSRRLGEAGAASSGGGGDEEGPGDLGAAGSQLARIAAVRQSTTMSTLESMTTGTSSDPRSGQARWRCLPRPVASSASSCCAPTRRTLWGRCLNSPDRDPTPLLH